MKLNTCTVKWLCGAIMVVVIVVLVLIGKQANAALSVVPLGINKHIVVKEIPDGHITYSYSMIKDGKLKLMDTVVTYKGSEMPPAVYYGMMKQIAVIEEAQQRIDAAKLKAMEAFP